MPVVTTLYLRVQGCEDPYLFVEAKSGPRTQSLGNASPDVIPLDFYLWGCKKSEIDKIKVNIRDELLSRVLDAAGRINKSEDEPRRTIRDLRTRVAKVH
jgi:hypothetical protein